MMDYLQLDAVLAVIILQRREAVRTLGDDLFDASLREERHILPGHLVEDVFVPQPAHAVAAALFILAQETPGHPGLVQKLRNGHTDMLVARVEGTGASDVEQVL